MMRVALMVFLWLSFSVLVLLLAASVLRGGYHEDVRLGYDEHEPPPDGGRARRPDDLPPPRSAAGEQAARPRPRRAHDDGGADDRGT